ncbi:hypothetical protein DGMP_33780 [Desulfomarina profundi]|uniref:Peptide methionine sulfoxide reductase MsrA n=1 Tax=Desulfomarina profundi TaxID=2772557 RepID=A0A8D5FS63_9BACT|nr:hypothetical protein DGMP_33780 [Desulfomarina profundi]
MQFLTIVSVLALFSIAAFAGQEGQVSEQRVAVFGGGCFWCMEPPFEQLDGVVDVTAGYCGGEEVDPTYEQVSSGMTGHVESVRVVYDPEKISFKELLDTFWRQVDPTDDGGQFADRGPQYRTAIFYSTEEERQVALQSKKEIDEANIFNGPIVTAIVPMKEFYSAEEYHQDYYRKNILHYSLYKAGSGRSGFLKNTWKKQKEIKTKSSDKEKLRSTLTDLQYSVTQNDATEPPFQNPYWNNKEAGIYVDIVSGEPFSVLWTSSSREPGGPVFPDPWLRKILLRSRTGSFSWKGLKCAVSMGIRTWGIYLMTVPNLQVCVTVSTRHHSGLFQPTSSRNRGMESFCLCFINGHLEKLPFRPISASQKNEKCSHMLNMLRFLIFLFLGVYAYLISNENSNFSRHPNVFKKTCDTGRVIK